MTKQSITELLREDGAQRRAALGPCPDLPELADYCDGLLDEVRTEAIREHVTYCPECCATCLELAKPLDWDPAQAQTPEREPEETRARSATLVWFRPNAWTLAAAALLAVLVAVTLREPPAAALVEGNPLVLSLVGSSDSPRGTTPEIAVPAGTPGLTVVLNLVEDGGFERFAAELVPAEGAPVRIDGLVRQPEGFFTLALAPELPAGTHEIRLLGLTDGGEILVEIYAFTLSKE